MPYNPDFTPMKNALYEESNRILTEGINYYVDALIEAGVPATRDALVSELVDGLPTNYDCLRAKDSVRLRLVAQGSAQPDQRCLCDATRQRVLELDAPASCRH